jgi:hypothetical protein
VRRVQVWAPALVRPAVAPAQEPAVRPVSARLVLVPVLAWVPVLPLVPARQPGRTLVLRAPRALRTVLDAGSA